MTRRCSACRAGEMMPSGEVTQNRERDGWDIPLRCSACGREQVYFEPDDWCE